MPSKIESKIAIESAVVRSAIGHLETMRDRQWRKRKMSSDDLATLHWTLRGLRGMQEGDIYVDDSHGFLIVSWLPKNGAKEDSRTVRFVHAKVDGAWLCESFPVNRDDMRRFIFQMAIILLFERKKVTHVLARDSDPEDKEMSSRFLISLGFERHPRALGPQLYRLKHVDEWVTSTQRAPGGGERLIFASIGMKQTEE